MFDYACHNSWWSLEVSCFAQALFKNLVVAFICFAYVANSMFQAPNNDFVLHNVSFGVNIIENNNFDDDTKGWFPLAIAL